MDKQALQDTFNALDRDGSGFLERAEVITLVRDMGFNPTGREIEQLMQRLHIRYDKNTKMTFDQFVELLEENKEELSREKELEDIRAAFMKFDNGDGKLDRDELRRAMTQLGDDKLTEQEFDELMQEADVDEDGVIDMSEFISFMTRRSYD